MDLIKHIAEECKKNIQSYNGNYKKYLDWRFPEKKLYFFFSREDEGSILQIYNPWSYTFFYLFRNAENGIDCRKLVLQEDGRVKDIFMSIETPRPADEVLETFLKELSAPNKNDFNEIQKMIKLIRKSDKLNEINILLDEIEIDKNIGIGNEKNKHKI